MTADPRPRTRARRARRARPEAVIVRGIGPDPRPPRRVAAELEALLEGGARLRPAGMAARRPGLLRGPGYAPRYAVSLHDATYYLTSFRFEEGLDFFVAFVARREAGRVREVFPRVFYKDSSLVWRVASHVIRTDGEDWIGKGDVRWVEDEEGEHLVSDEDTTNLPYEIQAAFDDVSRRGRKRRDDRAVLLCLRNAPPDRIRPYADFTGPRRRAAAETPLNGGRPVARITRRGDPESLRFARGFEPDLEGGWIETTRSGSRLYGGAVRKVRIASRNGLVQYQFVTSPTHVWINPPQALTREITSYGVRALHVPADDEVFLPGFEYHFRDDEGELHSQIPAGFAGAPSRVDPARADASAWIEALPVIRAFRRRLPELAGARRRRP